MSLSFWLEKGEGWSKDGETCVRNRLGGKIGAWFGTSYV